MFLVRSHLRFVSSDCAWTVRSLHVHTEIVDCPKCPVHDVTGYCQLLQVTQRRVAGTLVHVFLQLVELRLKPREGGRVDESARL